MTGRRILWWTWLGSLGLGAEAAAVFGAHGSWYQGCAIGTAVGMATWFSRPERRPR